MNRTICLVVCLVVLPVTAQTVIYVDGDAIGSDEGTSWNDAYTSLNNALDSAPPGSQVWVAAGTYRPQDAELGFVLADQIGLYGGFAGDEQQLSERDSRSNPTVLSGDLNADDVPDMLAGLRCLAQPFNGDPACDRFDTDGSGQVHAGDLNLLDNADQVVTFNVSEALIDGFVITSGFSDLGGGLSVNGQGTLFVRNCTIVKNASQGLSGRALLAQANLHISNSQFIRNVNVDEPHGSPPLGAGLHARTADEITIVDCDFTENVVYSGNGLCGAAGAWISNGSGLVRMENCRFVHNEPDCDESTGFHPTALSVHAPAIHMANCEFVGNASAGGGPAMRVTTLGRADVVNLTVTANSGPGIELFAALGEGAYLSNAIVWGNGGTAIISTPNDTTIEVAHSLIEGGYPGMGNIDADPLFVDPVGPDGIAGTADDDLRLAPDSPAIDAGNSAAARTLNITTDLGGQERFFNHLMVPDTGLGPGPVVDMGAHEFTCVACGDEDDNGIRDDPCLWQACTGEGCEQIDIVFADMGGQFGDCLPDGTADSNDRFHVLNCFSNSSVNGGPGYECENNLLYPPTALNVDAGGQFGSCVADGVCDGNDAFHALSAFDGTTTCACPLDGAPAPTVRGVPRKAATVAIRLGHDREVVAPGQLLEVDVFLDTPLAALRGYQLHVESTGGRTGSLDLVDIALSKRSVLNAASDPWTAFNVDTHQMLTGVDHEGVAVPAGHLATFTFRASDDARGEFHIGLLSDHTDPGHRTFLFGDDPRQRFDIESKGVSIEAGRSGR